MVCNEVRALLNARLDNEIDAGAQQAFDLHLDGCAACSGEYEQLLELREELRRGMPYYRAEEGLAERVRIALQGAAYLERAEHRRPQWRAWGVIAAAVVFCVLAGSP